jgi:hypothetical protein
MSVCIQEAGEASVWMPVSEPVTHARCMHHYAIDSRAVCKKGDRQSRSSNLDMYVRRELASCAEMECVVKPKKSQTLQQTTEKAQNTFRLCYTPCGMCESEKSLKELLPVLQLCDVMALVPSLSAI